MRRVIGGLIAATALAAAATTASAQEVTIAYQTVNNPWKVSIANGTFEKETGYKINFQRFSSGAKVITAVASGDVQIAMAGSSPIAAGVSRGLDMKLFWIVEDINAAEAMVVRNGAGVTAPQDLKGKVIGVPFVSTTHFHTLFMLEQFGIEPTEVKLLNMQPSAITAAWERGDIDGAFVWDPALAQIKKSGNVLITSGQLSSWGKATFDGMVVANDFADENKEFMAKFVKIMAQSDAAYRDDPGSWTPDSDKVKAIAQLAGGDAADVPATLALYDFPTMDEQASPRWLGGGSEGGAAQALKFTSEFLKAEKKIERLLPDYGAVVTSEFVEAAMKM